MVDKNNGYDKSQDELNKARLNAEDKITDMCNRLENLDKSLIPVNSLIAVKVQDLVRIFNNVNELSKYEDNLNILIDKYNYISMQADTFIRELMEMERQHQVKGNDLNEGSSEENDYELIFAKDSGESLKIR